MLKFIGLLAILALLTGCVALRPPLAPHRSNTPDHKAAKSIQDCLKCHNQNNMPHPVNQGDCLKCHRLELGE